MDKVESYNGRNAIILAFGEIDCMEHVFKNYFKRNMSINKILDGLTTNYVKFINELTKEALLVIYGPAFSGRAFNSTAQ